MKKKVTQVLLVILVAVAVFFLKGPAGEYLNLTFLKENIDSFRELLGENPIQVTAAFLGIYIGTTALSIPGATILTLGAGALFGFTEGLIIVSFASTIGATLAFLASRFLFQDFVQKKFKSRLKKINEGVERDGAFYLFTLRLVPIFPFFVVNLVMGLTPIKTLTFFFVSQVGMLLGTAVYVNAGVQLASIESVKDILSPELIGSFVALGLLPLVSKKIINFIKARKVYKGYKRPSSYDYNMMVIGAGSAGLVTAYISAAVKAKVALVEKNKMGGDCLNTGCVPSKALIKSAKFVHSIKEAQKYGIKEAHCDFDFKDIMGRVHQVIKKIEPHDSIERYTSLGVECLTGKAKILTPWEVEVEGKRYTTKNITIATGASPFVPPIEGIEKASPLTSENLWQLEELPKKLTILGGGPIGLEMAQSFQRLGSAVTLVEMGSHIMAAEDSDVSEYVRERLEEEGVTLLTGHKAVEFSENSVFVEKEEGKRIEITFDRVIVAVGRRANIKGFGLEELGIEVRKNGTVEANDFLQTNFPNIFVCGDVTGPYQLTHTASHQAWYCAVNGLFGRFKKFSVDYSVIPWATYTDPEVATVGKNEKALKSEEIDYEVTKYGIDDLDRAIADSADYGFVKVLTEKGGDKILGATIVGVNASDLLLEFISAMKQGYGLNDILGTIHPYPTMGEANKFAAGNWKRAHKPEKVLELVKKYHSWERG